MEYDRTITTDRLFLTPFVPDHLEGLFRMSSDPAVMRYLGNLETRDMVKQGIARVQDRWNRLGYGWWSIFLKDTDTLIGAACLQNLAHDESAPLEIGWRLIPEFQGQGYATEAGRAAIDFGFDRVGADYICAVANPKNTASQNVMKRLGMSYGGVQNYYDRPCAFFEIHKCDLSAV